MRDVGERATVNEGGGSAEGLHEVRVEGVLEEHRDGAFDLEVGDGHGLAIERVANDDARDALLEVREVRREAEDRHDLRGNDDVEAVFAWHALGGATEAHDDRAELAVVDVEDTLPLDAARVNVEGVALVNRVVDEGREGVVGDLDRVEVAREVEVDVFHGDDLGVAAAGRATLDAHDRAEGRLTQGHDGLLALEGEGVGKADGRCRLAFAGGGGREGRNEHELCLRLVAIAVDLLHVDLGLGPAVGDEGVARNTGGLGDLGDRLEGVCLGDLEIGVFGCHGANLL